jgi:hypothetical protein
MLKKIEREIIDCLCNLGIAIHVYHAYSTSSIYIKLDYGALGSIRISDHNGKERYHYKYNVRTDIEECYSEDRRNFYPASKVNVLLCDILLDYHDKINQRQYLISRNKYKENRKDISFWRECKEIRP